MVTKTIIAKSEGKRQGFMCGTFAEVHQFIQNVLAENPNAPAGALLDKLEPEAVTIKPDEVN